MTISHAKRAHCVSENKELKTRKPFDFEVKKFQINFNNAKELILQSSLKKYFNGCIVTFKMNKAVWSVVTKLTFQKS